MNPRWRDVAECREWDTITPSDPWWRWPLTDDEVDDRLDLCAKCPVPFECRLAHMTGPAQHRSIGVAGGYVFTDAANEQRGTSWGIAPRLVPVRPVLDAVKAAKVNPADAGIDDVHMARASRRGEIPAAFANRLLWLAAHPEVAA